MFHFFIQQQKQAVEQGEGRLSVAVYEFCIANPDQKAYLDRRFGAAVATLEKLIRYGQEQGAFKDCDARETASHIVVFLEGFRLSSAVITLPGAMIDDQLRSISRMVVREE